VPATGQSRLLRVTRQNDDRGDVQPKADDENAFLKVHSWDEFACWFLGLTEGPADEPEAAREKDEVLGAFAAHEGDVTEGWMAST
jgi:hypothetical protein